MEQAPVPAGTVAFLFSDIEGSTLRWDVYGEAMRDALRRHDEILRAEIESRRGYVFKTIGDAFCAAFPTVAEALDAAVGAQRRVAADGFEGVGGLRVRMAIAAGEADERDGDYFGAAVNRAARLLGAAHGGQVLLSGIAADLVVQAAPAVALRHLGTVPLRGFKEPERVYQALASDLTSEFEALRALETPPNNLPAQTTSFVGRTQDVARVESALQESRLVTILGAGGIGKTRLALRAAAGRLNDLRDGVWFVDLSPVSSGRAIESTILSALGADQGGGAAPLDTLLTYLSKRELLLVLDNCEHLVSDVARVAGEILAGCPHGSVLATSREALGVLGERVYPLSTLDLASAVRLFNDRALAAAPSFDPVAGAAIVEDICTRLDGIALAIELAAARVRTMSLETLSHHLELRLLTGGRDRRPRQQTMRALVDWSYELLGDEERALMRGCAVFAGGFTLGAVTAVCGGEALDELLVLDALSSLVDKSLVAVEARDPQYRYRLLEPVRQYAAERLAEAGQTEELRRKHARAFAAVARAGYEEWDTNPATDWLPRLTRELGNLRAALRWSIEDGHDPVQGARIAANVAPVFLRLSLLAEGIAACEEALRLVPAPAGADEARLRYVLSMLYNNQGGIENVLVQARAAASLYREIGDMRGLVRALSQVAHQAARQARFDEAQTSAAEVLALARQLGDRRLLAYTLQRCASAFAPDGADRVRACYAESVELFTLLGRDDETARALTWWAQFEAEVQEYRAAAERSAQARLLAGSDLAMHLSSDTASYYLVLGDAAAAAPFAREALTLAAQAGHPIVAPNAISYVAAIVCQTDAFEAARLLGYAQAQLFAAQWEPVAHDRSILENLRSALVRRFEEAELTSLLAEGAAWTQDVAVARATATYRRA